MNNLKDNVADYKTSMALAEAFADKYGEKIPKEVAGMCITPGSPEVYIRVGYSPDDRNRVLSLIADVFGPDGWKRRKDYGNETFTWTKTVDGVLLSISRVEAIDIPLNDSPVPKTAFPLQLTETTAA